MAVQFAPIAGLALRYGVVALATYAATRAIPQGRRDQRAEDALDDAPDGVTLRRDDEQVNATARWTRRYRFGATGPGVEIDAAGLGRFRIRRVRG